VGLIDPGAVPALERVARLAARALDAPVAQVNLVRGDVQVPKAAYVDAGVPAAGGADAWHRPVALDRTYCGRVVATGEPVLVGDARGHAAAGDDGAAAAVGIVAYAGVPLRAPAGPVLGSICVFDFVPREWSERDLTLLQDLAGGAAEEIVRRLGTRERLHLQARALAESEARFRAVFERSSIGKARVSLEDGRWLEVNDAFCEMLGYAREELLATRWTDVTHPEDVALDLAGFRRMAAGELESYSVEKRFVHRTGRLVWTRLTLSLVRDAEGRPDYEIAVIEDISERRAAEADRERLLTAERRARERIERLQSLTAALSAARSLDEVVHVTMEQGLAALGADAGLMTLLDAGGEHLEIAEEIGYSGGVPELWRRIPVSALSPVAESVRTGRPVVVRSPEERARRFPAVAEVLAEYGASVALPLLAQGRAIGALAVNRRVAGDLGPEVLAYMEAFARQCAQALDRARAYETAQALRAEAEAANRAKGQFLATMSHELRTPLNAIQGHVQLVEMGIHGPVTPAQAAALARVQNAQHHLLGLINDVLDFAKLEAGRVEYHVRETLIADVIREVVPLIDAQMMAKGLVLDLSLPEDPERGEGAIEVWADPEKLRQLLLNLLSNAIKFTPSTHESGAPGIVGIELVASPDAPERALIHVRDTGVGIPPDRLEMIFEPFVQVEGGLTRSREGTGLGLAISRELARGMGAEVSAESVVGWGSTFTVSLRRVRSATGKPVDRRSRNERRAGAERRRGGDRRDGPSRRRPDDA
jgi:PAS domain S-box-containing protein